MATACSVDRWYSSSSSDLSVTRNTMMTHSHANVSMSSPARCRLITFIIFKCRLCGSRGPSGAEKLLTPAVPTKFITHSNYIGGKDSDMASDLGEAIRTRSKVGLAWRDLTDKLPGWQCVQNFRILNQIIGYRKVTLIAVKFPHPTDKLLTNYSLLRSQNTSQMKYLNFSNSYQSIAM